MLFSPWLVGDLGRKSFCLSFFQSKLYIIFLGPHFWRRQLGKNFSAATEGETESCLFPLLNLGDAHDTAVFL